MDQETGKPRGFGFVTFEDVRDAQDAVADSRGKVGERCLAVSVVASSFDTCPFSWWLQSLVLDGNTLRVNVAKYPRGGLPHERFDRRQGPPMRGRYACTRSKEHVASGILSQLSPPQQGFCGVSQTLVSVCCSCLFRIQCLQKHWDPDQLSSLKT